MPTRVSHQLQHHPSNISLNNPGQSSYSMHRDSPTSSIRDDASSISSLSLADGRQRKRLHKNPESSNFHPRGGSLREPRSPPKRKPSGAREPRRPLVTRTSDLSPAKTSIAGRSEAPVAHASNLAEPAADIDALDGLDNPTHGIATFYAFPDSADNADNSNSLDNPFEFETLEDVHRGIIDNDQLAAFPAPGRKVSGSSISETGGQAVAATPNRPLLRSSGQSGTMLRRPSVTKYGGLHSKDQGQLKPRRQSTAPNLSSSGTSRPSYRKSAVTIEPESSARARRRPSLANASSLNSTTSRRYHPDGGYSTGEGPDCGVKAGTSLRSTKSKSLQPPPRQSQNLPSHHTLTPEHRASVGYPPKSPKSPGIQRGKNGTPGSTPSRRISMMPHMSGLAARTISPTDARRLKRMSMNPSVNTPPATSALPPFPLPSLETTRSNQGSPSLIPRKSATPSSSGTTPEPQRKSYNAGLSAPPATTSTRASISQPKLVVNLGNSRLPRPLPLLDRDDDDIPPVPPLPKNLTSPLEPTSGEGSLSASYENTPISTVKSSSSSLFGPRKSSLVSVSDAVARFENGEVDNRSVLDSPGESSVGRAKSSNSNIYTPRKSSLARETPCDAPAHSIESGELNLESFDLKFEESRVASPPLRFDPAKTDRETRRRRGMTLGPGSFGIGSSGYHTLETKNSASSLRKRDLAPMRLPPLNLLPLSTPTVTRPDAMGPVNFEDLTPPPKMGNRTPSTPMTASKVTFFGRQEKDANHGLTHERSMSSINPSLPPEDSPSSLSLRAGSSASSGIPVSASSRMGRQTISPYISSSLPKNSASQDNADGRKILGMQISMPTQKNRSRKSQDSLRNALPPEDVVESPTSSSIRRKLSLTWKKSSQGKNSYAATERAEEYNRGQPPDYESMPPPKLPSSSTWTPGVTSTPSPIKGSYTGLHARRQSSIGNGIGLLTQHDRTRSDSWGTTSSPKKDRKEEKAPAPPSKSSTASSILSPMQKMLGSKGSLGQLRSRNHAALNADPSLDHDDLVAEEEMRKLASKRKNLDQQASQLDELKKRATPKERMSPSQILRMGLLNIYEKGEIMDFKDVYFTGLPDAKKHVGDLKNPSLPNYGYDDERGDYSIIKGDHLAYRYEIVDVLGKGSFGQVVRCIDHKTGGLVAVKIIRNKKRFHQQALVEVNILQKLKEWDPHQKHSLINFTQSFYFRGHLCISTELLGMNLYEFIKSNDFRGFSLKLIRRFTKQMLGSLVLLKGHRVIHCDLKPENILLAHPAHAEIKVIDFGSSCFENEKVYTYIQSRFYRSPEVILGMSYGLPIDMWSLGCILAELKTGYPIFPGESEQEQLACIMEVFGPPEKHLIEKSTRRKLFFDSQGKPRMIVSSKGRRRRPSSKTLAHALKCDDEAFLDFVARCLRWDPDKRMRPDEAMQHEFITGRKSTRSRSGNYASATTSSDSKERRFTGYSRPLPEPPINRKPLGSGSSPMKMTATNQVSSGPTNTSSSGSFRRNHASNKRNSIGQQISGSSALPRVAGAGQRQASGKYPSSSNTTSGTTSSRLSTVRGEGAGTAGSLRIVRDDDAAVSSGGEGRRR